MIQINKDSLEARILRFLMQNYPVTLKELSQELKIKESTLKPKLDELRKMGILEFDHLPDKTFIRLLRSDFNFVGIRPEQRRGLMKKFSKHKKEDYEGMAYR